MEKRYYTVESLEDELREFEQRFGWSSDAFVAARARGDAPPEVDPFEQLVWADTYREACRLRSAPTRAALQPAG